MKAPLLSWPLADPAPAPLWREGPHPRHLTAALTARWAAALRDWGADPAGGAALERLADPRTPVVVTGQQPGAWGGPLYTLYKAATAVALAEALTESSGREAVAVFWINGDDTDWDEVGWGALPAPDLSLARHRWDPPFESRRWVGGATVAAPAEAVARLAGSGAPTGLLGVPREAGEAELGAGFAKTLLAYFGTRGLLPLDARWPELRAAGAELWAAYAGAHGELARAVLARGREIAGPDGSAALDAGAADHGLFPLDGDRRREIDPSTWEEEVRRALAENRPEALAPSVLLRAPLQDHLFGSAAHVVGRGEAAYLAQLGPVYDHLGVREPVRVLRLHATLVPQGLIPLEETAQACADPEAWIAAQARARYPETARDALRRLESEVSSRLAEAVGAAAEPRGDVEEIAASSERKILGQIKRLDEQLERRARRDLYRDLPVLRHLPEFLRPRRAEQDRGLSGAAAALAFGDRAPEALLSTAAAHVRRLAEGAVHHFVLEGSLE